MTLINNIGMHLPMQLMDPNQGHVTTHTKCNQGFIQDLEFGRGGETPKYSINVQSMPPQGGSGGMPPQKNFDL